MLEDFFITTVVVLVGHISYPLDHPERQRGSRICFSSGGFNETPAYCLYENDELSFLLSSRK